MSVLVSCSSEQRRGALRFSTRESACIERRPPALQRMSLKRRIGPALAELLVSPRLPLYLGLLTVALVSPSFFIGLNLDDFLHRYCGLQMPGSQEFCPSYLSFFTIIPGVPRLTHRLMEDGGYYNN